MPRRLASTSSSIPLHTRRALLIVALVVGAGLTTRAASIQELWPAKPLPDALQPAVRFQKVYLQIISGGAASAWQAELESLTRLSGKDPVSEHVRQAAQIWLARARMEQIGSVLRRYYAKHVCYPKSLEEVIGDIPEAIRRDPWDEPWIYSRHAPTGMSKLADQRYQLGAKRFPDLGTLRSALEKRPALPVFTKVALEQVGENKTLRLQTATSQAMIQPGGVVAGATLLHIGENWALLGARDQLFAITF